MDTGESAHNALTPLRREGRVAPVEPVVSNSCAFYTAHEAAGAAGTWSSLRPRLFEGLFWSKTSGVRRRENAE